MNTYTVANSHEPGASLRFHLLILTNTGITYLPLHPTTHATVGEPRLREIKWHDLTKVTHWEIEEGGFKIQSIWLGKIWSMKWGNGQGLSTWYCDINASGFALGK